jgi:hypothetical protein
LHQIPHHHFWKDIKNACNIKIENYFKSRILYPEKLPNEGRKKGIFQTYRIQFLCYSGLNDGPLKDRFMS